MGKYLPERYTLTRKDRMCPVKRNRMLRLWRGPWRRSPWLRLPVVGFAPLLLLYLCQLITLQGAPEAAAWMDSHVQAVFFTYCFLFLLQQLLLLLTRSLFAAAAVLTLPLLLFSIANHLKEVLNGSPILASDLAMTGQAGQIAGFLRPGMELGAATWQGMGLAVLLLLLALLFSRGAPSPRRDARPRRLGCAALTLSLLCNLLWMPPSRALLSGPEGESQGERNQRLGLLSGMYSALCESAMEAPDAYTENNLNRILLQLEAAQEPAGPQGVRPNIILILSESFFDVTTLPGITFAEDPIPNFHALQEAAGGTFLSCFYP